MADYPSTGSNLSEHGTNVSLSTFIIIKVGNLNVGAIKTLQINEDRSVKSISEVGTDGIIDSCPDKAATIKGSCDRTRFDRLHITEAFNRGFIHVKSQRFPFNIDILDKVAGADINTIVTTTIKNVWITSISYTISSDDYVIVDRMSWVGEDIGSSTNNLTAVRGGVRGFTPQYDIYEVAADVGFRRGALDVPTLNVDPRSLADVALQA